MMTTIKQDKKQTWIPPFIIFGMGFILYAIKVNRTYTHSKKITHTSINPKIILNMWKALTVHLVK